MSTNTRLWFRKRRRAVMSNKCIICGVPKTSRHLSAWCDAHDLTWEKYANYTASPNIFDWSFAERLRYLLHGAE